MLDALRAVKRLEFVLPSFSRVAWVSDRARARWSPILQNIVQALPKVFGHAILHGLYPCALLEIADERIVELEAFLREHPGLTMTRLALQTGNNTTLLPPSFPVVIGTPDAVTAFERAHPEQRRETLLDLQQTAVCCRSFQEHMQSTWHLTDATLAQALNTPQAEITDHTVCLKPQILLNTLLRKLGIQLLPHEPCSMQCSPSHTLAAEWLRVGRDNGFSEEMEALAEMLSWPVEWSALHGIAEIKTPILKISTNTDAMAERYKVQLKSDRYPPESIPGLSFPFQSPQFALVTDSKSFQQGLSNPILNIVVTPTTRQSNQPEIDNGQHRIEEVNTRLQPKPRSTAILNETFDRLQCYIPLHTLKIKSIYISNYFCVILLNDLSIGACMNYYWFKNDRAKQRTLDWLKAQLSSDPLLLSYLFHTDEPDLLQLSLKTCLISALSNNLLLQPINFEVSTTLEEDIFSNTRSAVVIGFGGYMDHLIRKTDIKDIHICDLHYFYFADKIQKSLDYYQQYYPDKVITFSTGADYREQLAQAELVSITASAFCNGTMDDLLEASQSCKTVIVQGQSGAIYPEILFKKGVSLVSTTVKPDNLMELALTDYDAFKKTLEGKLPQIYMRDTPKNIKLNRIDPLKSYATKRP